MNLHTLPDHELLSRTKGLVQHERELLTEILHHLREVERRRLFSDLGRTSLFDYAVRELGYSEDQAYRRINAMRLLKELPQLEEKIADGSLSLSALSVAGSLFKAEAKHNKPFAKEQKLKVLTSLTHKSRKESEILIRKFSTLPPTLLRPERVTTTEFGEEWRLQASAALQEKVARVKAALAHSYPNANNAAIFERLCDEFLARQEKKMSESKRTSTAKVISTTSGHSTVEAITNAGAITNAAIKTAQPRNTAPHVSTHRSISHRKHIAADVKRVVWREHSGKCRKCGSTHALQFDHIIPVARGGATAAENLRLLCRSCNQREAIKKLGQGQMDKYLQPSDGL